MSIIDLDSHPAAPPRQANADFNYELTPDDHDEEFTRDGLRADQGLFGGKG